MNCEQKNCREFLTANSRRFGITENNLRSECLDICAKNVKWIASRRIDERIVLPSMSNFINSCTGLVDSAGGIDTQFASLRVTHASEKLVDCDCDCPGVKVTIKGQIIVRTRPCNSNCCPSYMAIPVELVSEIIRDFYSTANGEKVQQLRRELPYIDGSCMVINLNCRVYREVCNGCSRYIAHVRGSVVDKLWKMENIWLEGIRPYGAPSITICDDFHKDICTCFEDRDYITMTARTIDDNDDCDNDCGCDNGCYNNCGCNNGCYNNNGGDNGCYNNCDCDNGCYTTANNGGCDCDDDCGCYTTADNGGCDNDCDCNNGCYTNNCYPNNGTNCCGGYCDGYYNTQNGCNNCCTNNGCATGCYTGGCNSNCNSNCCAKDCDCD